MTHRPPEPIRMMRTNRRFKVLWREGKLALWKFDDTKDNVGKPLEDWLNGFLKDKKHTHGIIIATTEFIVFEVHDVKPFKPPAK